MTTTTSYSGTAFLGSDLEPCHVSIYCSDGIITAIEEITSSSHWICPGLCNAHTHLADTIAMDIPRKGTLESLITPPNGLKHQILRASPESTLVQGMQNSLNTMAAAGISSCIDFREGGATGVLQLAKAASSPSFFPPSICFPIILGRDGGEYASECHGAGISSTRDVSNYDAIAQEMHRQGKLLAFHAGERDERDIDNAIACEPDLIVHATHATPRQIRTLADQNIPVAVCPRSNFILGVAHSSKHPPIQQMLDAGIPLLLGTDNVMFVQPDLLSELKILDTIYQIPPKDALTMAIRAPSVLRKPSITKKWKLSEISVGSPANFFIIDPAHSNLQHSRDPITSTVRRVTQIDIIDKYFPS
jgi:cytosine/adenosine deaminase-related metal-dependent hydrolase